MAFCFLYLVFFGHGQLGGGKNAYDAEVCECVRVCVRAHECASVSARTCACSHLFVCVRVYLCVGEQNRVHMSFNTCAHNSSGYIGNLATPGDLNMLST